MSNILMIGNDRVIINIISRILQRNHYEVHVAVGMNQAQNLLNEFSFKVIIIDRELPDGDGIIFCETLKKQEPSLKVLVLSSEASDEIPSLHAGADDWIKKPYNIDILLARIENLSR